MRFSKSIFLVLVAQVITLNGQTIGANEPARDRSGQAPPPTPAAEAPLIQKAVDGISSLGNILTKSRQPDTASKVPDKAPAAVAWVQLSRNYLASHVERSVDRTKPVTDLILGTSIAGESHTTGKTRFVLHPNDSQALGEVVFTGEVHADTVGHNGPATLHYLSDSTFTARKRIGFGADGLMTAPAVADAPTRLTATSIQTSLPRLRGRIAQRIAWRRVAQSQQAADSIASAHTARDIRHDLDRKVNDSLAAMQGKLQAQIAQIKLDGEQRPLVMRSRSTPDYIEVALFHPGASPSDMQVPSFRVAGNPDIAVRVHRSVAANVLRDPQLREKVAPLIASAPKGEATKSSIGEKTPLLLANLFNGDEWLAFDFPAMSEVSTARVALKDGSQDRTSR
jgi:hypothetical protein